jgi:anaerobic selenocysteine-containing dehydrogenase
MWCHSHCRVAAHIEDGRLVQVTEDDRHPRSSYLRPVVRACPRARAAAEWFYHPDRLRFPQKRAGERGQGKWQTISWDQALNEIADKLKKLKEQYGPETLALTMGTYRTCHEFGARFFHLFGSPNLVGGAANICHAPTNQIACAVIGRPINMSILRPNTRCVMLIGTNPEQSGRALWHVFLGAKKQGVKFIVIDPRRTQTAQIADIWLQNRPGTDAALLMGMINIIIERGLYDREFVEKWCYGFDQLRARASEYSLDTVSQITWVAADKIEEAAVLYATSRPAIVHNMMGLEQQHANTEGLHARFILPAITGNIDERGGEIIYGLYPNFIPEVDMELSDKLPPEQKAKMLGTDTAKLFSWEAYEMVQGNVERVWGRKMVRYCHCHAHSPAVLRAILSGEPYPVKAMITAGNNPMVTYANVKLVYKALKALELYVVNDFWMTPSAELADYVLPIASWLERPHIHTLLDAFAALEVGEQPMPAQVAGQYDRRSDYEFWRGLGLRLGQEEYWPWQDLEEVYNYRLSPTGMTIQDFIQQKAGFDKGVTEEKKYERTGFATPTGKVELYSTILEKLGFDPLPRHREPIEGPVNDPELAREYPLVLTTGSRFLPFYHSEHRQIESMRKERPHPLVQINPKTAAELGIGDGDWVWVETPRGRMKQRCQLFDGIDPRVVHAEHGWWFPEQPGEEPWLHGAWQSNVNILTTDEVEQCNPVSGGWPVRGLLCRLSKAKEY